MTRRSLLPALWVAALPEVSSGAEDASVLRPGLTGVWEVTAMESAIPRNSCSPETVPNWKYCFSRDTAYPELAPESVDDSADGGGPYYLVGGNILVIRTGAPGGIFAFGISSLHGYQLIWQERSVTTTLRRIAKNWTGKAPKIKPRRITIQYPA